VHAFDEARKNIVVFESIDGADVHCVKDEHCSREGHKAFGKSAVLSLHPLSDPIAFLANQFGSIDAKVVKKEIIGLLHEDILNLGELVK
jgi:hypothetical protein